MALAILKKVDAESLRPPPKFQDNIKIQLHAARFYRLSFRFLCLWQNSEGAISNFRISGQ